jgi:hypothetical protein
MDNEFHILQNNLKIAEVCCSLTKERAAHILEFEVRNAASQEQAVMLVVEAFRQKTLSHEYAHKAVQLEKEIKEYEAHHS